MLELEEMFGLRGEKEVWADRVGTGVEKMLRTEGLNRLRRGAG